VALDHGWGVPPVFGENPTRVFLTAVGGRAAPPWEVGLGLLVVELIFTYVCVCRIPVNQRMFVAPPTVRSESRSP